MRPFVLFTLFASITAAYAYSRGLKNRQDPPSLELPQCSVICLWKNGVKLSCIQGAGSDEKSAQCICDAFTGPLATEIGQCIGTMCDPEGFGTLEAYLGQTCLGAMTGPAFKFDPVPDTGNNDGQVAGWLQGSMLGDDAADSFNSGPEGIVADVSAGSLQDYNTRRADSLLDSLSSIAGDIF